MLFYFVNSRPGFIVRQRTEVFRSYRINMDDRLLARASVKLLQSLDNPLLYTHLHLEKSRNPFQRRQRGHCALSTAAEIR